MITHALMIVSTVVLVALLGVSIPTLVIVADRGEPVWPPELPYLSMRRYHAHADSVVVNCTTPSQDIDIDLPVGAYTIFFRVFAQGTAAGADQYVNLVMQTGADAGYYSAFEDGTLPIVQPLYLDQSYSFSPIYATIMDWYADIVVQSTNSTLATLGLVFTDCDDDDTQDTLDIIKYEAAIYRIA